MRPTVSSLALSLVLCSALCIAGPVAGQPELRVASASQSQVALVPGDRRGVRVELRGSALDQVARAAVVDRRGAPHRDVGTQIEVSRDGRRLTALLTAGAGASAAQGLTLRLSLRSRRTLDVPLSILRIDVEKPGPAVKTVTFPRGPVSRVDPRAMRARGSEEEMLELHTMSLAPSDCALCHDPKLSLSPSGWTYLLPGDPEAKYVVLSKPPGPEDHPASAGASVSFQSSNQGVVHLLGTHTDEGDKWRQRILGQSDGAATITAEITLSGTEHKPKAERTIQVGHPSVSFAQHLYPIFSSNTCNGCHASGSLYPQKTPRPTVCAGSGCSADTIPFDTTITADEMRSRFTCLKACSTDSSYTQAFGKVYVVASYPSYSGLHFKAQESTAPAFGDSLTIGGVDKPLREWITIWIEQGANP